MKPTYSASLRLWVVAALALLPAPRQGLPPAPPKAWLALLGEYGPDTATTRVMVLERDGKLLAILDSTRTYELTPAGPGAFRLDGGTLVRFAMSPGGRGSTFSMDGRIWRRRPLGPEDGTVFRVRPLKPVAVLRKAALADTPPNENGTFRNTDLAELKGMDSTIHLDIRYAGTRNFLGTPLYSQARAFLQRPAAEALVRAHRKLLAQGYGLLIHDGYRPWYVTKMFWDATPPAQHEFVANPPQGSRHNRGEAVDLSMYEISTGKPVEMPGTYDEFSHRSYPGYIGGTSRQRWLRELLRSAMEAEGFTVNASEWWHFDYKDWKEYRIGNQRFEEIR